MFGFGDDGLEGVGVFYGEKGEDFSVKGDIGFFETCHEFAVIYAKFFGCYADTSNPESAKVALFGLAVAVCIITSMEKGFFGDFVESAFGHAVAFGGFEDGFVSSFGGNTTFYSRHCCIVSLCLNGNCKFISHLYPKSFFDHGYLGFEVKDAFSGEASLVAGGFDGTLVIHVLGIVEEFSSLFATFGDFYTITECFSCFALGHGINNSLRVFSSYEEVV